MAPVKRGSILLLLVLGCAGPAFRHEEHEGVHDAGIEWWYLSGFLGDEHAIFCSFFRTKNARGEVQRYLIYDLVDLRTGASRYRSLLGREAFESARQAVLASAKLAPTDPDVKRWLEAVERGTLPEPHAVLKGPMAESPGDPLRLRYDAHLFERGPDGSYAVAIRDRAFTLELALTPADGAMYIGGSGLTGVARPEDMHYYTIPRLTAEGTLNGRPVRGELWYDHQWGESWRPGRVGWSWWGVVTADGEAINAYELRDRKSGEVHQRMITSSRRGVLREARFTPLRRWESPRTKIRYPVEWRIEADGLRIEVEPMFDDREAPALGDAGNIWEGPVRTRPAGRGFQELVGYRRD